MNVFFISGPAMSSFVLSLRTGYYSVSCFFQAFGDFWPVFLVLEAGLIPSAQ